MEIYRDNTISRTVGECNNCGCSGAKKAVLTWSGSSIREELYLYYLCKKCFDGVPIDGGWCKKRWYVLEPIDTLKNPREAVMF